MALSSLAQLQLIRILLLFFVLFDVVVSSVLFLQIGSPDRSVVESIADQIILYNFGVSSFDLWLLSLLRMLLFTLLVLIFCFNKVVILKVAKKLVPILTIFLTIIFCYSVAKLLASFEYHEDGSPVYGSKLTNPTTPVLCENTSNAVLFPTTIAPTTSSSISPTSSGQLPHHPWLWAEVAWSMVCVLLYGLLYYALTTIESSKSLLGNKETSTHEEMPLLGDVELDDDFDENEELGTKKMSGLKVTWTIITYAKPDIHLYALGFISLIISAIAMSSIPFYTGMVINNIILSRSEAEFQHAILIMVVITIVSAVTALFRASFLILANGKLQINIRKALFKTLLHQDIGFFDKIETGDLTSRLTSDTTKLSDQIALNLNIFLRNLVIFIGSLFFMIKLTWKLSTITIVGIPIITMVTHYFGNKIKDVVFEIQGSFAKANNTAEECLSSMRTVRSFANEEAEFQTFQEKLRHTLKIYNRKAIYYGAWMLSNNLLELMLQVVTLYYGGCLVFKNQMTGGELVALLLYQVSLTAAIDAMTSVAAGLMEAVGAAEKVFELIDRRPEVDLCSGSEKPDRLSGLIQFQNVSFSYPTRPNVQVLKNVNFTVHAGEMVALVGPSGGGKSSCISMLERFYEPQSGTVLVDGRPLSQYDHTYIHTKMSLVGQEPVLYSRSVAENISCCLEGATQESIEHAAKLANAHNFITTLTNGYDTQTGEKGAQLSGGQKQRVAIARALIRDPTVLLLDEATSALDAESEHQVQQALNKNLHGRTVIVIAHRLSTVEKADRIIVINKGEVVEQGSHSDLLKKGGLYATLVRKQMTVVEKEKNSEEESQEL